MRLHDIKPNPGSKHRRKRVGRGESSGTGKTAGRGHKGQKSRSGGGVRLSFEGGQMPIYRRLPKRGFNNAAFKVQYAVVNVGLLEERFDAGSTIDEPALREAGIVKGRYDGVKILGDGEVSKAFTVSVTKVSASAREKLEKAGGTIAEAAPEAAGKPASAGETAPAPAVEEPPAAAEPSPAEEAPAAEAPVDDASPPPADGGPAADEKE